MLVKALSRKLLGYFVTLLFIVTVAGCGGGGGSSTGNTPESPIAGNETLIEARTSGNIIVATVNGTVSLDGSKSYISTNTPSFTSSAAGLSFSWAFTSIPEGSSATLLNPSSMTPSFVADVVGDYIVQLVVSAKGYTSKRALQTIVVAAPGDKKPTGTWNHVGLGTNCIQCHDGNYTFKDANGVTKTAKGKPGDHVATSMYCQACHTPKSFAVIVKTDHGEVSGNCSGCHNNVKAVGKSEFHQQTTLECNECHNTVSFLTLEPDGSFNHANITRSCSGCHNGTVARGKHEGHVDTKTDCGFCHTTVDFKNAYPDHTGPDVVGKDCSSCHNGTDANDSTGFHSDMSVDCAVCHNITSFNSGGVFDHTVIGVDPLLPACSECHAVSNNIGAIGKSVGHPDTSDVCSDCHNIVDFADVTNFDHGTLDANKACADCHGDAAPVDTNAGDVDATGIPAPTATFVHVDTAGLDCGACHTPGTFSTGTFDHALVDMNTTRCDSCHDDVISDGLSSGHIPLAEINPADCDVCHNDTVNTYTYSSFATPVSMNHTDAGVDSSVCGVCHDGDKSSGKSDGHIPTDVGPGPDKALDCYACHFTAMSYTSFALTVFDHSPIDDTDCASCHDKGYATPKSATHIPSVAECSVCHTNTTVGGFVTADNFRTSYHDSLTWGCEGCHVAKFFPGNVNSYKANTHLPTAQDCYFCHSAAATDFSDYSNFSHEGITSNCSSCHDGSFVGVLPNAKGEPNDAIHNSISADCSICHTTNNAFADTGYVDHNTADIKNVRCVECHNGDFNPDIKGMNFIPNASNTNSHPAVDTSVTDCSACHASDPAVDFKDGNVVDHSSAEVKAQRCDNCHRSGGIGKPQSSNHIPIGSDDCSSCHDVIKTASFKRPTEFVHAGITNNCESCHNGSFVTSNALGKNQGHINTTDDCSVCHVIAETFVGAPLFSHQGITSNCVSCHNGVTATGKNSTHFPTDRDCVDCHKTTQKFPDGTFDHVGIDGNNCASCHDAGYGIQGKSVGHPVTSKDCSVCHSGFDNFADGIFSHDNIANGTRCDSCHDGNTATGKVDAPPGKPHLPTTLDCDKCHSAGGTFTAATWLHEGTGNCTNCHDGRYDGVYPNIKSQSSSHIATSIQCDECHTTKNWVFSHQSPGLTRETIGGKQFSTTGNYPGDHGDWNASPSNCSACHVTGFTPSVLPINNTNFPWKLNSGRNNNYNDSTAYIFRPQCAACHANDFKAESEHNGGKSGTVAQNANCGGCHEHSVRKTGW